MTGDQVKGKGFRSALRYNLQKVDRDVAKILDSTFTSGNEHSIMAEVALVRVMRPNLQKYFYHTSINFPPSEDLNDEQMNNIANEYLNKMGFVQNQHVIFRHFDAEHPHLHILVNRIGYDGTVVSDSKDYQRSEQVLRSLEKQFGLTEVISSKQSKESAMTKDEWEMMKRTSLPSVKIQLQEIVKEALNQNINSANELIRLLEAKQVNLLFNQASTGFVSGISYGYKGMQFKGAHLGNAYKWQAIKNNISYEQERDRTAIHQANVRTRAGGEYSITGQTRNAGQSANTERKGNIRSTSRTTLRAFADQEVAAGNRKDVQQSTGYLPVKNGNVYRADSRQAEGNKSSNGIDRVQVKENGGGLSERLSAQQQDRQQVDCQGLSRSDLISDLLGLDHHAADLDNAQVNEFKRRKKKKKGHRLG
ncbi:relaxase/mobilization nuclease domain-containing protein [Mucilaginibacter ginkgonis]|uniref:Relaxase/mobilization nuclease domain-containing protein n=1 Tax=Mucilaginibacter ginkgonis TaxID=2682091 RepID=A0A6I4HW78_9SPHI|nr:relaxase/mobilization nuclease domain-containing protein [Mucilaginibacter ginkgonis]QQL51207.1 relaxase/mobilization nuclease domain-containing protein [Mucilaginibacter ginkgonis]